LRTARSEVLIHMHNSIILNLVLKEHEHHRTEGSHISMARNSSKFDRSNACGLDIVVVLRSESGRRI
jgi:hypothetical protein